MNERKRSTVIVALVAITYFMENLDGSIITTALPQMARLFDVRAVDLSIGITSYLLTLAVFIPVSGWAANRTGMRSIFTTAIAVFTVASVVCGRSHDLAEFTSARIVQGIGGAMMVPIGRIAILRTTSKDRLMRTIAFITWPGLVAPIIGPPLGGLITTYSSWRWIFYLNLPVGALCVVIAWFCVSATGDVSRDRFDGVGFALCGIAGSALMYATELVGRPDTPWCKSFTIFLGGLAAAVLAIWHLRRSASPIVDLSTFRINTFAVSMGGGSLFRVAISAIPFLLPLMFQLGFGMNALESGMLTLAVFLGNLTMKPMTTTIMRRFGYRAVLLANGGLVAVNIAAISLLTVSTPFFITAMVLFLSGLLRSLQFTAINTLAFVDVPDQQMSAASTLCSTITQIAMGMGVALGAIALRMAAWMHGHDTQTVVTDDFQTALLLVATVAALAIFHVIALERDAGALVSGHSRQRR